MCVRLVGFEHPTAIQAAVIPEAVTGRDLIGLAETGSGKTAAFTLPIADRLARGEPTRGLILSPTREIALQTQAFLDLFGKDYGLKSVTLIGGVKMGPQL
ncbi:MAG TPA: DEAD/DEAH box helicase, partial [Thermoanaerobaculia bacterium]|nr:DEAD/DEAH box helicase [Thermoanaerobaculia bacterium]